MALLISSLVVCGALLVRCERSNVQKMPSKWPNTTLIPVLTHISHRVLICKTPPCVPPRTVEVNLIKDDAVLVQANKKYFTYTQDYMDLLHFLQTLVPQGHNQDVMDFLNNAVQSNSSDMSSTSFSDEGMDYQDPDIFINSFQTLLKNKAVTSEEIQKGTVKLFWQSLTNIYQC